MSYSALVQQAAAADGGAALPFASRRSPVYARRGLVACSQPLAAEAGLRVLQRGGNAADAAVAVAAALGVTEPCSTGAGGDAFGLFFRAADKRVLCLEGNGAAPAALTLDAAAAAAAAAGAAAGTAAGAAAELPPRSALCVSVPGAVAFWEEAVSRWGRLSLGDVLAPAIELAEEGFPVAPLTAAEWARGACTLCGPGAGALAGPDGRGPAPGQLWRNSDLAKTYRRVAELGARQGFYSGPVAEAIVAAVRERGGVMAAEDLAAHRTRAAEPLRAGFRGHTVWEVGPPTAGVVALMACNVLEEARRQVQQQQQEGQQTQQQQAAAAAARDAAAGSSGGSGGGWTAERLHLTVEALRLAFADALARVADPLAAAVPVAEIVCAERGAARFRGCFDPDRACRPEPCSRLPPGPARAARGGDTCQWVVVDADGNAASMIQSNYMGFGSGIVPAGCGFSLQNRAHGFTLQPGHPNTLAPGKRPYHTILPALLTDAEGRLAAAFGCMGGYMQPQGHVQLLINLLDLNLDPQAALDAPRFCIDKLDSAVGPASVLDSVVLLEEGHDAAAAEGLRRRGHDVRRVGGRARSVFGKGTIITRDPETGVLCGGTDPRGDGAVFGW